MLKEPLVSVVMPAYKHKYIDQALDSLFAQTYSNIEVIICDDSTDDKIKNLIEEKYQNPRFKINYSKNEKRLWGFGSVERGVELASGEYIKILHDDDVLLPECIRTLVSALEKTPTATLATSKRQKINEINQALEDDLFTISPFVDDVIINGPELVSFLADNTINFIGEPSCTLCRKKDLLMFNDRYSYLNGVGIAWVGDLAFYIKLLRQGDLIYFTKPLAHVRTSTEQLSQIGRNKIGIGEVGHANFRQAIRDLGWYRNVENNNLVQVAPLSALTAELLFEPVDLLDSLLSNLESYQDKISSVARWLSSRVTSPAQQQYIDSLSQAEQATPSLLIVIIDTQLDSNAASFTKKSIQANKPKNLFVDTQIVVKNNETSFVAEILQALVASSAIWVICVQAGTEVTRSGLLKAQLELSNKVDLAAVSFDEIYRQIDGSLGAALRPSINLDYLLSFPAGNAKHWLFNRQTVLNIGGFNPDLAEAFELDVLLRIVNQRGLEALGHIAEPLVITEPPALMNIDHERIAIEAHLQQRGYIDAQIHAPQPGRYQIRYNHQQQPIVSIVIAAHDNLQHLQRCIEGLLENTAYQKFEILLFAQAAATQDVRDWLAMLADLNEAKLRIIDTRRNNLATQYNQAAEQAIGDYLLFLSADTAIVSPYWLDELLNHAQRAEVGIVGAKLLSADGKVAHAGHILGLEGPLGSPFVDEPLDAAGYMQRLQVDQNLSAVAGDCLMVFRELFIQLDGFADIELAPQYLSADLCLRAREAGYLTVWTPRAQLMLDRPMLSMPNSSQQDVMYAKWLPQLARDPAYNPNFSLTQPGGFKLADNQISWRPLESLRPAPVALVHPADLFGCGHYRVIQPFLAMQEAGLIDGAISTGLMHVSDLERYSPDTIILQRQIGDERIEAMQRMQRFSKAFKVYELDDYLPNLPLKNAHRAHMPKDILRSLRKGLSFVDRFVVSTEALAEAFKGVHGEIVVMENRLPVTWWQGLQTQRRQGKKPRVGWAGGAGHTGDLELIADVVRDLADEVEWVFLGMCPEKLRPYMHEFHEGVAIADYPAKLASLNLDLGLAPLEMNLFNECKSNLRLLEFGICGIPMVCTDIRPYQNDLPVTRVRNRYKDWIEAIRLHINDLDATAKRADELQARVQNDWMLKDLRLEQWRAAWLP